MAPDFTNYIGLPLVGNVQFVGRFRVIKVSSDRPQEIRDADSVYAGVTTDPYTPITFLFIPEEGGLLLQIADNLHDNSFNSVKTEG